MDSRPKIPADVRRKVLVEAGHRCAIQTCRESSDVDLHHIIPWAQCKEHKAENLIALCPNCHRKVHKDEIDRISLRYYKEICQKLMAPPQPQPQPQPHQPAASQAYIKFNPNLPIEILDSKNIDSLIDNGVLDVSFCFVDSFDDLSYVINVSADGPVNYQVTSKSENKLTMKFVKPCPSVVKIDFDS